MRNLVLAMAAGAALGFSIPATSAASEKARAAGKTSCEKFRADEGRKRRNPGVEPRGAAGVHKHRRYPGREYVVINRPCP